MPKPLILSGGFPYRDLARISPLHIGVRYVKIMYFPHIVAAKWLCRATPARRTAVRKVNSAGGFDRLLPLQSSLFADEGMKRKPDQRFLSRPTIFIFNHPYSLRAIRNESCKPKYLFLSWPYVPFHLTLFGARLLRGKRVHLGK